MRALLLRWLPWFSFLLGVAGALLMDRGPRQGMVVAAGAVAVWITLIVLNRLRRLERPSVEPEFDDEAVRGRRRMLVRAVRVGSLVATQSLLQLTLFFAVPFYWQAATLDAGHGLFLVLLGLLCAVALWDPWSEWVLTRPVISALFPAMASFIALNAVLPGFGISTQVSLWLSSGVAVLGVPLAGTATEAPERRLRTAAISLAVALVLPGSLLLGGARIVPAAPLRLVDAAIATDRAGKWVENPVERLSVAPKRLICATAIYSPFGLHDRLFHVWEKNGVQRARVELEIVGGRTGGYRTQSRIGHFGKNPAGTYRCTVETATGQVLGSRSVRIDA